MQSRYKLLMDCFIAFIVAINMGYLYINLKVCLILSITILRMDIVYKLRLLLYIIFCNDRIALFRCCSRGLIDSCSFYNCIGG